MPDRTRVSPRRSSRLYAARAALGAGATAFGVFAVSATAARAQPTVVLAPPVTASGAKIAPLTGAAAQSVFPWQEVPIDRRVPITRAFFDQDGYQLLDDVGETIVVPFVSKNLFVMRFGHSSGSTYFVNDGSTPTLYLAEGGFLENAAAQGARWYPFPHDSQWAPSVPVYIGFAPTWDDYEADIWYPKTIIYGGYWHYHPSHSGVTSLPMQGYTFTVGGHTFHDWHDYHQYAQTHPLPRRFAQNGPPPGNYHVPPRGMEFFGRPKTERDSVHDTHVAATAIVTTSALGSTTMPAFTAPPVRTEAVGKPPMAARNPSLSSTPVTAAFATAPRVAESSSAPAKAVEGKDTTKDSSKDASQDNSAKTDSSSGDTPFTLTTPANTSPQTISVTTMALPPFGFRPYFIRTPMASRLLPVATTRDASERGQQAISVSNVTFRVPTPVAVKREATPSIDLLHVDSGATSAENSSRAAVSSSSEHSSFRGGSGEGNRTSSTSHTGHSLGRGLAELGRKAIGAILSSAGGQSHSDSSSTKGSSSRSESNSESRKGSSESAGDSDKPHHK